MRYYLARNIFFGDYEESGGRRNGTKVSVSGSASEVVMRREMMTACWGFWHKQCRVHRDHCIGFQFFCIVGRALG